LTDPEQTPSDLSEQKIIADLESGETLTAKTAQLPKSAPRSSSVGGSMTSGMNAVLETAALMHASGQAEAARDVLEQAIETEPETAKVALVWLALLDIYQQIGDKDSFDRWGMEYAIRFEQSPPVWVARNLPTKTVPSTLKEKERTYVIVLNGDIALANIELLGPIIQARKDLSYDLYRLDMAGTKLVDDGGATKLAKELAEARQKLNHIVLEPWPKAVIGELTAKVREKDDKDGSGYWQLLLELLQWRGDEKAFDQYALEYAIRFEVSPPVWAPKPPKKHDDKGDEDREGVATQADRGPLIAAPNVWVWSGILQGGRSPQLEAFKAFVNQYDTIIVDMHDVLRVDFAFGGALVNIIARAEAAHKKVRFIRTSPMVLSLLLLVGVSPRAFSRRRG
jgi:hypothetical protein